MKFNKKTLFNIIILTFLILSSNLIEVHSNEETWTRKWRRHNDGGRGLVIDSNEDIYVVGDTCLLKYSKDGDLLWESVWDLEGEERGESIAIDSSENLFIAGIMNRSNAILLKCDKMGNIIWNRTWGGPKWDTCHGLVIDSLDNIYIAGYTDSYGPGFGNIFVVKFNNSGSLLWELIWGTSESETFSDISIDNLNNIYIVGESDFKSVLIKINSSGNELWNTSIVYGSYSQAITTDSQNNIIYAGTDILTKYNTNGEVLWFRFLKDIDFLSDIAIDNKDNIYILEDRTIRCPDNVFFDGVCQCICTAVFVDKYNSSGDFFWEIRCTGCNSAGGYGISLDSLNNLYICGISQYILLMKNPKNWSGSCPEIYLDLIAIGVSIPGIIILALSIVIIKKKRSKKVEDIRTNLLEQ
ncbi:MAG: SBBP repeat-containing protein [Candidatus Lokiarchaeota archaeon]|nr:SBBP repeat-containing protein [Candidatus Lokiarchaeota archaeon]